MATSSFKKSFVLDSTAAKKMIDLRSQPGVRVSASSPERIKEGQDALARFLPRSKK